VALLARATRAAESEYAVTNLARRSALGAFATAACRTAVRSGRTVAREYSMATMPTRRVRNAYRPRMRHVVFVAALVLYVVVVGQNWAYYTAAVLLAMWIRYDGRLGSVPFTVGRRRTPIPEPGAAEAGKEDAPSVTSGT